MLLIQDTQQALLCEHFKGLLFLFGVRRTSHITARCGPGCLPTRHPPQQAVIGQHKQGRYRA